MKNTRARAAITASLLGLGILAGCSHLALPVSSPQARLSHEAMVGLGTGPTGLALPGFHVQDALGAEIRPADALAIAAAYAGPTAEGGTSRLIDLGMAKSRILGTGYSDPTMPAGESFYLVDLHSGGPGFGSQIPQPKGRERTFKEIQVLVRAHGGEIVGLLAN